MEGRIGESTERSLMGNDLSQQWQGVFSTLFSVHWCRQENSGLPYKLE